MSNWDLDSKLKNGKSLIEEAKIKEVFVLEEGEVDWIAGDIKDNLVVHTVINVKIKPVIFKGLLEEKCKFDFHHDINIEKIIL